MNFDAVLVSLPLYLTGLLTTIKLLLMSLVLGLAGALPLAVLRASSSPWLSRPVWCFTYLMRGTPMLVQLFILYYGLAQFEAVRNSAAWPLLSSAWFCAVLAFGLNTCAYTTEIIAGALRAGSLGELEAAQSLGLSRSAVWRRILLPSALRRALPAYGNEVIMMLHGTSLASIVTLADLTGAAREVNSRFYLPFEAFITAGLFYLALTLLLVALFRAAEQRWLRHLQPRR
ncbi:ABC transporter permease [Roseateles toxinivorans]|uniref:Arginine/ornithine transport system permease protein n=1 Tax=Roseateles toxinivorans TaxID=270368 RepID=A0A4R6QNJ2_9BURK|nr:ABC transporter permease [Roseateles toxinivorans]TDP71565.1 arginine/ornithine transport system permease protein [Roseateles toxinivorans]